MFSTPTSYHLPKSFSAKPSRTSNIGIGSSSIPSCLCLVTPYSHQLLCHLSCQPDVAWPCPRTPACSKQAHLTSRLPGGLLVPVYRVIVIWLFQELFYRTPTLWMRHSSEHVSPPFFPFSLSRFPFRAAICFPLQHPSPASLGDARPTLGSGSSLGGACVFREED